jgi:flagellin-like hook-associated protein FlgL
MKIPRIGFLLAALLAASTAAAQTKADNANRAGSPAADQVTAEKAQAGAEQNRRDKARKALKAIKGNPDKGGSAPGEHKTDR